MTLGAALPRVTTPVPGPRSRALGARLARVESRNVTRIDEAGPIFWTDAAGANVRDADGNIYVDLTAGFGVAAAGHAEAGVGRAVAEQASRLMHALGDVHPAAVKVELLERLAALAPGDLSVSILSASGSDAVESAWKTATLATGRPGIVAFRGGYHGLGFGALALTHDARFRQPFRRQLYAGVRFAAFPDPGRGNGAAASLEEVRRHIADAGGGPDAVGAVFVEPVQGRGGINVPPADFLPALRQLCTELGVLLVLDEVYTGFGRTGRWFACEHWDIEPDLLVVGKALAGGLPLSAVIGTPAIMQAWPASEGEALHTSTFLGNPVACAAALAQLRAIEQGGLVARAASLGRWLRGRLDALAGRSGVQGSRGLGLMQALVFGGPDGAERALRVAGAALGAGVIVLTEGPALAFTPPLTITEAQLEAALRVIERALAREG
ncbi:MAG TPA: aspartate aminotransferase family protein [Longimicrobiales bacterium]|nr:aspartate aminotransferase family protein [Longimicrobiales bacterium]